MHFSRIVPGRREAERQTDRIKSSLDAPLIEALRLGSGKTDGRRLYAINQWGKRMTSDGSVTHWIHEIKAGNPEVAQALWERYFTKLVGVARARLEGVTRRSADEEDVALSVFDSFCRAAAKGRFPSLADRDSLWRLLVRMAARKAIDQRRHEGRQRRGGGAVVDEGALAAAGYDENALAQAIGNSPTPEFAAIVTERFQILLDALKDDELKKIAMGKMEGYENGELADQLGCSLRTIERRLMLVREICRQEFLDESNTG